MSELDDIISSCFTELQSIPINYTYTVSVVQDAASGPLRWCVKSYSPAGMMPIDVVEGVSSCATSMKEAVGSILTDTTWPQEWSTRLDPQEEVTI